MFIFLKKKIDPSEYIRGGGLDGRGADGLTPSPCGGGGG
jgi:hypothetical protein